MDRDSANDPDDSLTYAGAGVDIEQSEAATAALIGALGEATVGGYAGVVDIGDRYLGLATDGVGTKLLVAEAIGDYSTIGIDCIAMNVNDLVAAGIQPLAFVDYLAVESPDELIAEQIGEGLARGAERADIILVGGETAVMPEVIRGVDLAGTCAGIAAYDELLDDTAHPGDILVGFPSTGIHSNGLTLAREAALRDHSYSDPYPLDPTNTIADVLLEPTEIYTPLLGPMHRFAVRSAAHITGGGWTNLERLGNHRYEITDPLPVPSVFEFIQEAGNIAEAEMYKTFNMGIGFVVAIDENDAHDFARETDGHVIGAVSSGAGVDVNGLRL